MKNGIFLALIFVFGLSAAPVCGADDVIQTPLIESATPLTPQDLFEIALHHSPDYQKTVQTASISDIGIRSAWGAFLPTLDVGYQLSQNNYYQPTYTNPDGSVSSYPVTIQTHPTVYDTINGHVFEGKDPSTDISVTIPIPEGKSRTSSGWISLRETIRLGGQQIFGIRNANIAKQMNDLELESSEITLYSQIRQNYYNVLAKRRLYDLAKKVLEQKQEQLRLAKARFEIGSVTELDVLQAEIDVGNQENAIITAQNNVKLAQEELNRVVGIDLNSTYPMKDDFVIFDPKLDLNALIREALAHRPDYRAARKQEEYQRNLAYSRRGEFLPDLSASLTHSRSQNSGGNVDFTFNPRNRNTSMSVSLTWNLFSGFADQAQYESARVNLRNSSFDLKKQEQTVEKEVRQAYYSLMQTYDQSQVTAKNRELASRQLALEQERYRLGATSQLNLRAAQVTYEQAEADYIANVFSFWTYFAALESAVGKKIE